MIGNETLERVEESIYLGNAVGVNPSYDKEIARTIRMGCSAFGKQCDIINNILTLSLKRKVYSLLVLTYGSENWHLTKQQERKLRSAQRGMERKILGVPSKDRKQATWIREQIIVKYILTTIKMSK